MAITHLLTKPCTIVFVDPTDQTTDDDGNLVSAESSSDTLCYYEQRATWDETIGQNVQVNEWLVILPAETVVNGYSRIVIDEQSYEMFGPEWRVWNPRRSFMNQVECRMKRTV